MKIVSFHNGNIDPEVIKYQRLVFEHFGYEIEQVETNLPHGEAIDEYLKKPFKQIAIFDIDCIPLTFEWMDVFAGKFAGAAQQANHINKEIYISPAFICFTQGIYKSLGKPSFAPDEFGDVGYKVTEAANRKDIPYGLIWPTHVEVPKWDLGKNSCFGLGTTYSDMIYHAFESRMGNGGMFVRKCKEVLNGKG